MAAALKFDTTTARPATERLADTHGAVKYPRPFVALPRLAVGFSRLDAATNVDLRAKATVSDIGQDKVNIHAVSWSDANIYTAITSVLALAPANRQFAAGEHMRDLTANPKSPASVRINFEYPFATPPKVVVFLNHIELPKGNTLRLRTNATAIDEKGFTLNIETWNDSVILAAQAAWVAYPVDNTHIFSTTFSTYELRRWQDTRHLHSKDIEFGDTEFWKNPDVFVALNQLDFDQAATLRVQAYVDNVTQKGLTWHINSWDDTIMYGAGACLIAFNP